MAGHHRCHLQAAVSSPRRFVASRITCRPLVSASRPACVGCAGPINPCPALLVSPDPWTQAPPTPPVAPWALRSDLAQSCDCTAESEVPGPFCGPLVLVALVSFLFLGRVVFEACANVPLQPFRARRLMSGPSLALSSSGTWPLSSGHLGRRRRAWRSGLASCRGACVRALAHLSPRMLPIVLAAPSCSTSVVPQGCPHVLRLSSHRCSRLLGLRCWPCRALDCGQRGPCQPSVRASRSGC